MKKTTIKHHVISALKIAVLTAVIMVPAVSSAVPVFTSISATQLTQTISVGSTYKLSALALDSTGWPVSPQPTFAWTSSDAAVATIDTAGLLSGVSVGTVTITVSSSGISTSITMSIVSPPAPVLVSIYVNPREAIVMTGATQQLVATAYDSGSINPSPSQPAFVWATSDTAIGTVDASGLFTAIAPGTVTVTASHAGISGTAAITVAPIGGPLFARISLSGLGNNVPSGYTTQLLASAWEAGGFNKANPQPTFTWTSSDTTVATVDPAGLFRAVGFGTATITVSSMGISASKTVTVGEGKPITASAGTNGTISPSGTLTANPGATQTYTITPNAGFQIADVVVDGVSSGAISSYTFTNVAAAHTIHATFVQIPAGIPSLALGWNLIGWINAPLLADALGLANAGVDMVSKWDSATQLWISHIVNFPLNNFLISAGDGVFVHKI